VLVDTHAHLSDAKFDADRDEALARAAAAGVAGVVEIADNEGEWPKARALAERHPGVFWTAGLHPHYADKMDKDLPWRLRDAVKHPRCVAVGEIGLDYYRNPVPPYDQQRVFFDLLQAAADADKPVVIHCREADASSRKAQEDMLSLLKSFFTNAPGAGVPDRGVLHCFQGHADVALAAVGLGFFIGVDGPLGYPNAGSLRDLAKAVPLDRLVLETDSPYLPPQAQRGKRNEPSYITAVAEELARVKGVTAQEVARQTTLNAEKLYRVRFLSTEAARSRDQKHN
jgi:TatD DNase family protein